MIFSGGTTAAPFSISTCKWALSPLLPQKSFWRPSSPWEWPVSGDQTKSFYQLHDPGPRGPEACLEKNKSLKMRSHLPEITSLAIAARPGPQLLPRVKMLTWVFHDTLCHLNTITVTDDEVDEKINNSIPTTFSPNDLLFHHHLQSKRLVHHDQLQQHLSCFPQLWSFILLQWMLLLQTSQRNIPVPLPS